MRIEVIEIKEVNKLSKFPVVYNNIDHLVEINKLMNGYWLVDIYVETECKFFFIKYKTMKNVFSVNEETLINKYIQGVGERLIRKLSKEETDFVELASWAVKYFYEKVEVKIEKEERQNQEISKFKNWNGIIK